MTTAVCPGSFDPVTYGHLDVIGRTVARAEAVIVAVGLNTGKASLFTAPERAEMIGEACADWPGVSVSLFGGLLTDFCTQHGVDLISKGLRSSSDFDYELQMAQLNRRLSGVDTVFVPTSPQWSYLSSSRVRELASFGADVSALVPPSVAARIAARAASSR